MKSTGQPARKRRRWPIVAWTLVAAVLLFVGVPRVIRAFNTISTDDAYVNGYVTFVAPRVSGQVARVLVDDNNRVKKGDVLVELDPKPYQAQVAIKQATLDTARANLVLAQADVRGLIGQARSNRFKLARAIEDVDNQVALIRARVATWEQEKATVVLAQREFDRAERLLATKVVSQEEYDERREALDVAKGQLAQALENVYQARVALGLPAQPPAGSSLADVPADLDKTFSSVRQAQADLRQSAAQLGVFPSSYNQTPKQMLEEFHRRDPTGDLDRIYAEISKSAPSLKVAETNVVQAQSDVDQAKLDLSYCTVFAEIDGVVTRRNVKPGDNLQVWPKRHGARWLIAAGLLILAAGNFWMSQLNLDISPWQAVWPREVMIAGLGMIFAPLRKKPPISPPSNQVHQPAVSHQRARERAATDRWETR